jgi:uncharacterized membrane protein (DUF4010 family)
VGAWQSAAIALAIGFLIGSVVERDGLTSRVLAGARRERRSEQERNDGPALAGVRTFALAGLAGALAALVNPFVLGALVAAAAIIVATVVITGRPESADPTRLSAATAVALVLTVVTGGLAVTLPALAAGAGVATAVVLLARDRLHQVVRDKISELELADALKFFVAAFIVLPLMPHASLGPYGVIDPRRMWTFVVAVTALGWLGYVAVRLAGPQRGLPAAGLAGGFVSGAATTGAMARASRDPELFRPAMAAALLASVATLVQLVLVTAVADGRVAALLLPAAALGAAVLVGEAGWLVLRRSRTADVTVRIPAPTVPVESTSVSEHTRELALASGGTITSIDFGAPASAPPSSVDDPAPDGDSPSEPTPRRVNGPIPPDVPMAEDDPLAADDAPVRIRAPKALVGRRPFALIPALLLTAILTVFLVLSAVAEHAFGPGAAVFTIAAAGLADSHAGALTAANLASQATLTPQAAVLAAMAALAANTVVKLVLAHVAGGRRASTTLAALFAAPVVAIALGLVITLGLSG